jgi:hypothetical protein
LAVIAYLVLSGRVGQILGVQKAGLAGATTTGCAELNMLQLSQLQAGDLILLEQKVAEPLVGVLLMLCLGVLWYARNSRKVPTPHTTPSSLMELQGTLLLDRRAALHMLRVDGHDVAVTTDASGLKSVVVLTEPFDPTLTSITDPA